MMDWPSFRGGTGNTGASPVKLREHHAESARDEIESVDVGGLIWGTPVVGADGAVYVGSTNRRFVRIDSCDASPPSGCTTSWAYSISSERADSLIDSAACLVPSLGLVAVPGGDGTLHGLDAGTGAVRWLFHARGATGDEHSSGVVVNSFEGNVQASGDGALLYAGNDNGTMYCLEAATGSLVWSYELPSTNMVWTVPALTGGLLMFGSLDGHVYALGAGDGLPAAPRHDTGAEIKASPVVLPGGDVVFANSNGSVIRLTLRGPLISKVWSRDVRGEVYSSPALDAAGGAVIVGTMQGIVAALRLADGAELWTFDMGPHAYTTSSPVLSADRVLVLGNSHGRILALDARDGALLGCVALSHMNLNSSPVLLPSRSSGDETGRVRVSQRVGRSASVVIGSYDGHVYVVPAAVLLGTMDGVNNVDASQTLQLVSGAQPIASYRYNGLVTGDGGRGAGLAVNPATLRVRTSTPGHLPYEVTVSPDGGHVNFLPSIYRLLYSVSGVPPAYSVAVTGTHYKLSDSWFTDRMRRAADEVPFGATVTLPTFARRDGKTFPDTFALVSRGTGAVRVDLHRLSVTQPTILDTYIPAAIAGIGYVSWITAVRRQDGRSGTFLAVLLPAVPEEQGAEKPFAVLREPSKVQCFAGRFVDAFFEMRSTRPFTISGMGGTMTFADFRVMGSASALLDPSPSEKLSFYARASCLRLRGNGASYKFSKEVVNKLCDRWMDMHVVGTSVALARPDIPAHVHVPARMPNLRGKHQRAYLVVRLNVRTGATRAAVASQDPGRTLEASGELWTFLDGELFIPVPGIPPGECANLMTFERMLTLITLVIAAVAVATLVVALR
jgi:outer membrane protein assembly factor BamB